MKFLVSGSLKSKNGPRTLLNLTLIFFAATVVAHGLREASSMGLTPTEIRRALGGGESVVTGVRTDGEPSEPAPGYGGPTSLLPAAPAKSALMLLEDMHVDLFLYATMLLVLTATLGRVPLSARLKKFVTIALFTLVFIYPCAKLLVRPAPPFAYLVWTAGALLHPALLLLIGYLFYYLNRPSAPSNTAV